MAIVIYGCGGHARSVIHTLCEEDKKKQIILVDEKAGIDERILGFLAMSSYELRCGDVYIVAVGDNAKRKEVYEKLKSNQVGSSMAVISHAANVGIESQIGDGTFVAPCAYIGPQAQIGFDTIINTGSIIEHETVIGNHTHISPRAVICGRCRIGNMVFCGAGSTVIDQVRICDNVIVGAGAVVIKDITEPGVYAGVPARKIKDNRNEKDAV